MTDIDILERQARTRSRGRVSEIAVADPILRDEVVRADDYLVRDETIIDPAPNLAYDPVYRTGSPARYAFDAPLLGGEDAVALVLSVIMALGPLTMYALGYGL